LNHVNSWQKIVSLATTCGKEKADENVDRTTFPTIFPPYSNIPACSHTDIIVNASTRSREFDEPLEGYHLIIIHLFFRFDSTCPSEREDRVEGI
jgi:hypothetical protein